MPPPSSTDRDALIAALAEQARSDALREAEPEPEELLDYLAGRLDPEELLDYLAGRLDPEEARRIERLLVASPDAARDLLNLADLEAAGATAGKRPPDLAVRAGWRDLRAQLPDAPPRPRPAPPWLSAIAAALLVATVGLGSWALRLHSALHRPIPNLVSLELPSGIRADTDPVVEIPPGEPLRLVLAPAEPCPGYAAEVEGPRDGDHQTIVGLKRDKLGRLTPQLWLEPGSYRLRLLGCEPRRELEQHRFRIIRHNAV